MCAACAVLLPGRQVRILALRVDLQHGLGAEEAMGETQRAGVNAAVEAEAQLVAAIRRLETQPGVQRALEMLRGRTEELTQLQIEFARIPAPDPRAPQRGAFLRRRLEAAGLQGVRSDAAGNVIGVLPRRGAQGGGASGGDGRGNPRRVVVLSAHLDTVFPELTDIEIQRDGGILRGPGIADDAAGLAAIVHLADVLCGAGVQFEQDVAVVGTVGEEGEGDLRGVKHLFSVEFPPERVAAFLTLDLGDPREIVNSGLGSRRLCVRARGPGGHSWGAFGRPNPIHALARGIERFLSAVPSGSARTSYNVGCIEGGRGVNVIPESASARVDLRGESAADLATLETSFRAALEAGLSAERAWSRSAAEALQLEVEVIGDRPAGTTPADSGLVRAAVAAFSSRNLRVRLGTTSTDANEPMRLGVPAVALPHGVRAHDTHSLREWCRVEGRATVLEAELLTLVHVAGYLPEPPETATSGGATAPPGSR